MQTFSGEGNTPSPDPTPLCAYGASIFAPTALKLNVTPPKKIVVTALQTDKKHCRCDTLLRTDINIHRRNSLSQKKLTVCKLLQNLS